MNKENLKKFVSLVKEDAIDIEIVEAPWGSEVTLQDNRDNGKYSFSDENLTQMQDFLSEYRDLILKFYEIEESYDGLDYAWNIGKIASENIDDKEITQSEFALITNFGGEGTYTGQMKNIYETFPNKQYHKEYFTKSYLGELTQTVDKETVRKINENANKYEMKMRKQELRAIRDIYNDESNELKNVVDKVMSRKLFDEMSTEDATEAIYNAYLLLGKHDVSKMDIKNLIN